MLKIYCLLLLVRFFLIEVPFHQKGVVVTDLSPGAGAAAPFARALPDIFFAPHRSIKSILEPVPAFR